MAELKLRVTDTNSSGKSAEFHTTTVLPVVAV